MDAPRETTYAFFSMRLRINRLDLDTELIEQPEHFQKVGEEAAYATSRAAKSKDDYRTEEAKAAKRAQTILEGRDERVTDKVVSAMVQRDKHRQAAFYAYLDAEAEAAKWAALRDAWASRGFILRDLVQLTVSGYLAETSSSVGAHETRDRKYTDARERMAKQRAARREQGDASPKTRKRPRVRTED